MHISVRQKNIIESEAVALASLNPDGNPNVIAVAAAKVVNSNTIIITDNFMNQTSENIKKDSRICLAVWTKDWSEGYKIIGNAVYEDKGRWFEFVKQMKENKDYHPNAAIVITVKKIIPLGG